MKIEENIPMNDNTSSNIYKMLIGMNIGDSIIDEGAKSTSCKGSKLYASAQQAGIRSGMKFSGRKVENGVRIWRVA